MKYTLRAVKYMVKLALLMAVVFALMQTSGTSNIESVGGVGGFFAAFFATARGQMFAVALVVWCAAYPAVEFKRRHMNFDLAARRDAIVKALRAGGMVLASEEMEAGRAKMVFRGEGMVRRVWWMGDEAVTLTACPEGGFDIEGPRRFVMEAQHRIPNYVGNHES
ncbi:MAG: hypothetical protein LBV38_05840 [Alistipes sp.]|jgi:hypothetical protein|nr:hypothetical protein [Alistipes sp.]